MSATLVQFAQLLPVLAVGLVAGWSLCRWSDTRRRADRVVGGVRELHPTQPPRTP